MENSIAFPNLGILLKSVGSHISIRGFEIAYYGILIGIGIFAGILIAVREAKRSGQDPEMIYDLAVYGVICSIVGARIYYVAFSWEDYKGDLLSILNIRQGGLAIYGGIIGAVLTIFVYSRIKKLSPFILLDLVAPGLAAGQMIGRWGNFFNREAFGEYTNNLFAMRLPLAAVRSGDVTEMMRRYLTEADGISFIQVHPTFFYESCWCLLLLLCLLWYSRKKRFDGEIFLFYLMGYGAGRAWIEGLRTDQLRWPGTDIAVSQVLAIILILLSAGWICSKRNRLTKGNKSATISKTVKDTGEEENK